MAVLNHLDETATRTTLTHWLSKKLDGASNVEIPAISIPASAGMSMTTILFSVSYDAEGRRRELDLVARVTPATPGIFREPDLAAEFALLTAVAEHTAVPVPRVRWLEDDPALLGGPFLVMDRVDGRVPGDDPPFVSEGWVVDLSPAERGRLFDNALGALAELHDADPKVLGVEFLHSSEFREPGIAHQLAEWRQFYDWTAESGRIANIEAAYEWLEEHRPDDDELVLCWGDARLGNIIFGADQSVAAVLDWEMATIASPQLDLGWFVLFVRYYSEGIGVPLLKGLPTRDAVIARYRELTGRSAADVDYYERFAAYRLAIIMARIGRLMISGGALPEDSAMPANNPASQVLARLFDLPAPEGAEANYIGHR
ncbi:MULTISPECIES: phosphotransferase family protein [unclassified Rhodococcus (in: high G+C Gram-positive bacteria)]|uniref:phosphotransferase family protein n=1 Tax=unclassified Rhodococcus (in: high G+C Gram-positive bacteria) TaxID=192944 RepID=UPI00163B2DF4|nr:MULTISPECIES: phosphotransferase family protein [unclassified Rhodococcus (in: high G+C Gram-positive bacteria)]MBC2644499.1 phosphotransferase family protein [Rhodococcus sp. 3A]MBC2897813.1 phosphotransferase family protein [Rhodococcus sp. 4CII]